MHTIFKTGLGGLCSALLAVVSPAWALEYQPFVEFSSFSHSEPIAVHAILNDWNAPFSKGDVAFSVNKVEVGLGLKQGINTWQFSVFERQDYLFEFSPATAKLLYQTNTQQDLVVGQTYDLQLKTNSFVAKGLKLGYQRPVGNFNVGVAVAYLEGQELTDGALKGQATAVANNDYNFNFDADYYYSKDALFDRTLTSTPKGQGYGVDVQVDGFILPNWHASLKVQDAFAQINWWDAPRTVATGSSQTKEYDENGFVKFNPVANGVELNQNYTQIIPTKVFAFSRYEFAQQHSLLLDYQDYSIKQFYSLGYRFENRYEHKIDVLYNATAQAVMLSYQTDWLALQIISDALELEKARTLGLNLALCYRF